MKRAMDETERRRTKQLAYNEEHDITPVGVKKSVEDILEAGTIPGKSKRRVKVDTTQEIVTEKSLVEVEKAMLQAAQDLEFEKAARLRDELSAMRDKLFK
jgi:excinuclease ABC subunit B